MRRSAHREHSSRPHDSRCTRSDGWRDPPGYSKQREVLQIGDTRILGKENNTKKYHSEKNNIDCVLYRKLSGIIDKRGLGSLI